MFAGPVGDVHQGGRAVQACGQKNGKDGAVGVLGVGGKVAVDDGGDVELVDQRPQEGQSAQIDDIPVFGNRVIDKRHGSSMKAREEVTGAD